METAHHILIYGCTKPGSAKPVWNCGEMMHANKQDTASPCSEGTQVLKIEKYVLYFANFMDIFRL